MDSDDSFLDSEEEALTEKKLKEIHSFIKAHNHIYDDHEPKVPDKENTTV